jgi:hypothetical protein
MEKPRWRLNTLWEVVYEEICPYNVLGVPGKGKLSG